MHMLKEQCQWLWQRVNYKTEAHKLSRSSKNCSCFKTATTRLRRLTLKRFVPKFIATRKCRTPNRRENSVRRTRQDKRACGRGPQRTPRILISIFTKIQIQFVLLLVGHCWDTHGYTHTSISKNKLFCRLYEYKNMNFRRYRKGQLKR